MFKVIIKDWQSIKEAKLAIEGLTLVVGQTGEGKSACLRALRAAVENKFAKGQVRYGEKTATIAMQVDGHTVIATKPENGSPNMSLDGTPFARLNRTVPEQIASVLNMSPLSVEGSYNLNIAPQFQPPLLVGFSQKKVLDLLSSSQALDDLNIVKGELSVKRSETNGAFKSLDSILTSLKEQDSTLETQVKMYAPIIDQINSVSKSLDENVQICRLFNELYDLLEETNKMSSLCESLDTWINSTADIIENYISTSKTLSEVTELISLVNTTEAMDKQWQTINDERMVYELVVENRSKANLIRQQLIYLDNLKQSLDLKADYDSRKEELEQVVNGSICPICGRPMSQCEDNFSDTLF